MPSSGRWTRRGFLASAATPLLSAEDSENDNAAFLEGIGWRRTPIDRIGPISYFIDEPQVILGGRADDAELARWALQAWDHAVSGRLCFYPEEAKLALVRIYWGQVGDGLGRMQAIPVGDLRGGEVFVHPDPARFDAVLAALCDSDPLMRDLIVYRTLLHEIGHALGLVHTTGVDDVMYFGGDVGGYYSRYRGKISGRKEFRRSPALSETDLRRIREQYPERPYRRPPKPPNKEEAREDDR